MRSARNEGSPRLQTGETGRSGFAVDRSEVFFPSGGLRCAATLYRPVGLAGAAPCVVLAHGFSGTRDLGLPRYAERFAVAGLAAFVFDYRHFGGSEGQPRQIIDIAGQLADYRAAIRFVRTLPGIDPTRIALWGTSLSGGHVIAVAADDPSISALVAQVPWVGIEFGRDSPRSRGATLKLFGAALYDELRGMLRLPPHLIPVVGNPNEVAAFTDPEARAFRDVLTACAPGWRNAFAPRVLFTLLRYRPGERANRLQMPILVCVAATDVAGSVSLAVQAAERAPRGEVRRYPMGHWDVYVGEDLEAVVADQIAFLQAHLLAIADFHGTTRRAPGSP